MRSIEGHGARDRGDHDGAGFGLPPGVDDRAAVAADGLAVPHPRLRIDGLSHRSQQAQRGEIMLVRPLVAPLDEGADRGRGRVEHVHLVAIDDRPEAVGLGIIRSAFVHQAGGAVLQRPVHDVAVPRDPPDVGRTPERVFILEIKN